MREKSDEEKRALLKAAVVRDTRELIKRRDQLRGISDNAQDVFNALVDAKTWHVARGPEPSEEWVEPQEVWSMTPHVTRG